MKNISEHNSALEELLALYFAPLDDLRDLGPSNIFINSCDTIFYEFRGKKTRWEGSTWNSDHQLAKAIKLLANSLKQPINPQRPILDARLSDGSRVNAILPPITPSPTIALRLFPRIPLTAADLEESGSLSPTQYKFLSEQVRAGKNMLISGCTDAGKTTLLKMLAAHIPSTRRLLVLEDTAELNLSEENHPNMIAMEAARRDGDLVTMSSLVINTMRMSPDALILGELRDAPTAAALRTVLNTGVTGIMSTLHANTARETLVRVHDLIAQDSPNVSYDILARNINRNIDVVVSLAKNESRGRHVQEIIYRKSGSDEYLNLS